MLDIIHVVVFFREPIKTHKIHVEDPMTTKGNLRADAQSWVAFPCVAAAAKEPDATADPVGTTTVASASKYWEERTELIVQMSCIFKRHRWNELGSIGPTVSICLNVWYGIHAMLTSQCNNGL